MTFETFDFDNPQLSLAGVGLVDCSDKENFSYVLNAFPDKREILESAKSAASKNFGSRSQALNGPNPHNQIFSPIKWTAWNTSYSFWMKHYRCKGRVVE